MNHGVSGATIDRMVANGGTPTRRRVGLRWLGLLLAASTVALLPAQAGAQSSDQLTLTSSTAPSTAPSTAGQAVTFTSTLLPTGGAAPTGTVSFQNVTNAASPVTLCAAAPPAATTQQNVCQYTFSTAGVYTIQASYSGDANYPATTATLVQVVNNAACGANNFGSLAVGSRLACAMTVPIAKADTATAINTFFMGVSGKDYVPSVSTDPGYVSLPASVACGTGTAYTAGQTCLYEVTFAPQYPGARDGAVTLTDSSSVTLATAYVQGIGLSPLVAFEPGTVSSLGAGWDSPSGIAVGGDQNIYVTDQSAGTLYVMPLDCTSASCKTQLGGSYSSAFSVSVDGAGNLYLSQWASSQLTKLPPGCTSTNYNAGLCSATQVTIGSHNLTDTAVDGAGNVYVVDNDGNLWWMPANCTSTSCVTLLVNVGGIAASVALDYNGNIYIANTGTPTSVQEIPASCTTGGSCAITTMGGGYTSNGGARGVAVDAAGYIYVADQYAGRVYQVPPGCTSANYAAGSCTIMTLNGSFNTPYELAVGPVGNVYVAGNGGGNGGSGGAVMAIDRVGAPAIDFMPTSEGGSTTAVQSTSPASAQTIVNIGNEPLLISVPSAGTNPAISDTQPTTSTPSVDFSIVPSGTTCPLLTSTSTTATLGIAGLCNLGMQSNPVVSGDTAGQVTLTDNSLNATGAQQTIDLTGAGVQNMSLSPTTLPNGTLNVAYANADGTAVTLTGSGIAGTGTTPPYAWTFPATGLPPGLTFTASGTLDDQATLAGNPTAAGSYTFPVQVCDSTLPADGGPFCTTVSYTVIIDQLTLTSSTASSTAGQTVTFTSTLLPTGGVAPTGTVIFQNVTNAASPVTLCAAAAPAATTQQNVCQYTFSTAGTYTIQASYSGDANYLATVSATLTQQVVSTRAATPILQSVPLDARWILTLLGLLLAGSGAAARRARREG